MALFFWIAYWNESFYFYDINCSLYFPYPLHFTDLRQFAHIWADQKGCVRFSVQAPTTDTHFTYQMVSKICYPCHILFSTVGWQYVCLLIFHGIHASHLVVRISKKTAKPAVLVGILLWLPMFLLFWEHLEGNGDVNSCMHVWNQYLQNGIFIGWIYVLLYLLGEDVLTSQLDISEYLYVFQQTTARPGQYCFIEMPIIKRPKPLIHSGSCTLFITWKQS